MLNRLKFGRTKVLINHMNRLTNLTLTYTQTFFKTEPILEIYKYQQCSRLYESVSVKLLSISENSYKL
jgi:hypothetical protein